MRFFFFGGGEGRVRGKEEERERDKTLLSMLWESLQLSRRVGMRYGGTALRRVVSGCGEGVGIPVSVMFSVEDCPGGAVVFIFAGGRRRGRERGSGGKREWEAEMSTFLGGGVGALKTALESFSGVNMTRIESRPEYSYGRSNRLVNMHVDFHGSTNKLVEDAIAKLRNCPTTKSLRDIPWFPRKVDDLDSLAASTIQVRPPNVVQTSNPFLLLP